MKITIEAEERTLRGFVQQYKGDDPYYYTREIADAIQAVLPPPIERIPFDKLVARAMERTVVRFSHYGHDVVNIPDDSLTVYSITILNLGASINVHSNSLGMSYGGPGITVFPGGWVEVAPK